MEKYEINNKSNNIKKKILIVTACNVACAGVPIFLYNILSNMKLQLNKICIHIYIPGKIISQTMANKFLDTGVTLYIGGCGENDNIRQITYQDLEYLTSLHNYDVIHSNSGKVWINYFACYFGIKNNIPKRIVHSHSALLPRIKPEVQKQDDIYRKFILENATDFLACSEKAAKWLFGSGFQDYTVLKNGIDLEKYRFDREIRDKYRKELGIENKFVIGHAGRFGKQKNHAFLIDIFKEITKYNEDSVLLMAGGGTLFEDIKCKTKKFGMENKCMFLGVREDMPGLLQAMDVFVLPSLFEGFPVSLVEARASGLPCITSDEITEEVCLLKEVERIPLKDDAKHWAEKILKFKDFKRESVTHDLELSGYDAQNSANYLLQLYSK